MLEQNLIKMYEKSFRDNREMSAVTDYFTGETYSYYGFAKEIAKLHIMFDEAGIKPKDKISALVRCLHCNNHIRCSYRAYSSGLYIKRYYPYRKPL